jgi:ABC-type ATPase involved in cell division
LATWDDEGVRRQHELDLRASAQEVGSDDAAQLREQDAQPRAMVRRRLLAVDGGQQLVAIHPTQPVEHEVGEEQLAFVARQRFLDPPSVESHDEPAAELDSRLARLRHRQQA